MSVNIVRAGSTLNIALVNRWPTGELAGESGGLRRALRRGAAGNQRRGERACVRLSESLQH